MRMLFVIEDHTEPFASDGPEVSDKSITFERKFDMEICEGDKVQIDGAIYRVKTVLKIPVDYAYIVRNEPVQMVVLLSRVVPGFDENFEILKKLAEAA